MNNSDVIFTLPALRGGGAERVVLNICELLSTLYNYKCHIILFENEVHHTVPKNVNIHILDDINSVNKRGFGRILYRKKAAEVFDNYVISNFPKDIVIFSNMLFSDKILSKSKLNVINIIHNSYTESILGESRGINRLKKVLNIKKIYKQHPLLFVSRASKISFERSFYKPELSEVIYNPLNYEHVYQSSKVKVNVSKFGRYIIHVGRFNRAKRHDRLLNAFSLVEGNVKLILLGDGKLKNKIEEQIRNLNLEDRVIILGFNSNPYPYIRHADCLILTSDFEGLGMVLLEAISLNVPVLATETPDGVINEVLPEKNIIRSIKDKDIAKSIDNLLIDPFEYIAELKDEFKDDNIALKYHRFIQKIKV